MFILGIDNVPRWRLVYIILILFVVLRMINTKYKFRIIQDLLKHSWKIELFNKYATV